MRPARSGFRSVAAAAAALCLVAATTRPALAVGSLDYTVTATSGLYEAPPTGAVLVGGSQYSARVDFPFEFTYFGVVYDHATANVSGLLMFGNDSGSIQTNGSDPSTVIAGSTVDGACTPLWCCLQLTSLTSMKKWVAGTAPNRRLVVSWESCLPFTGGPAVLTHQVRIFEGSNRIEFAYKPDSVPTTWANITYSSGMVAPGADTRWVAPVNTSTANTGHPPNDYRFDPRPVAISGRVLYERLDATQGGLSATTSIAPVARTDIDVLYTDGRRFGRAITDANGNFVVNGFAGPTDIDVFAVASGAGCVVKAPLAQSPFAIKVGSAPQAASDSALGTKTVDVGADPTAAFRAPITVACAVERARAWLTARTVTTIPKLAVEFDVGSAVSTGFAAVSSPLLTIASPAAPNPDSWDDGVVIRTYARYPLSLLSGAPATPSSDTFDTTTDTTNAFAVAFGHFLAAAVDGKQLFADTTSTSSALSYDLEAPQVYSAKAPDVAAWVATALYDLLDPANEASDTVDGSNDAAGRVVQAVDALGSAPDAASFLESWDTLGFDGPGASRIWVANGLVADDPNEPNDTRLESATLGALGTRVDGLALNVGNEDWFDLTVAAATDQFQAEMTFPRGASVATVELQLLDTGGASVADKVDSGNGPVSIAAANLAPGAYRLRVAHVGGKRIPAYTLQASRRLTMDRTPLPAWTVGLPYERPIALVGGVGNRAFEVTSGTAPVGLQFNAVSQAVSGTPFQAGTFDFSLVVQDSGNPVHIDTTTHHVVINPALDFELGEFVPFAVEKTTDATRLHAGGTPPLAVSLASGALPAGISVDANDLRFTGTTTAKGSTPFGIHVVDVAGSVDDDTALAVGCVAAAIARSPADLAAGTSACGWYFDAVAGSSVKFSAGTAAKRAKRAIHAVLIGPDGLVLDGAATKNGTGKASASISSVPATGRYYAVVASKAGAVTQLVGTATVAAPKRGRGSFDDAKGGDVVVVQFGALAGAKLTFKAASARGSNLALTVLALINPAGAAVALDGAGTKGTSATLVTTLGVSGTWTLRVRATGSNAADVSYSLKIAEPKGGTFSAD